MKVNDIFHCDVKKEYRYTKMCIVDTHEIMFDLNVSLLTGLNYFEYHL